MAHTLSTLTEDQKNKVGQRAGSRGTALWPVPKCQKIWHMGTKKIIKKQQKTVFFVKKIQSGNRKEMVLLLNSVLEDILIYHLRLEEIFFLKTKFQKITCVNFVGPDPRLLEMGTKWRTHWGLKLKIKKNKGCQRASSRGTALWPVPICQKIWHMGTKKIIKNSKKQFFYLKNSIRKQKRAGLINI